MATLVGVPAARSSTAASARVASWRRPALRTLSVGLFLLAWHAATLWDLDLYVRFQNIPSPGDVLAEAAELFGSPGFYVHILASLERIWLGFAIATVLGVGLGLLIGRFAFAEDTLLPPIELFRPIPAVAWVPISIMLWPTERSSIVFITTLGAFFPMGLSVGMGVSWICLISAEMISGQFGVGYFTWVAYGIVKYAQIVVGMLTIGVLGMLSSALIRLIGARFMPWLPRREKEGA